MIALSPKIKVFLLKIGHPALNLSLRSQRHLVQSAFKYNNDLIGTGISNIHDALWVMKFTLYVYIQICMYSIETLILRTINDHNWHEFFLYVNGKIDG